MDVLRLYGPHDLRVQSEARPIPAPDQVLIRVTAVGVCGSDLHWFDEAGIGDAQITRPLVLGHEFAGVVESQSSPLHGQRVAVDPAIPCQVCEFCLEGSPNLCANLRFAGHGLTDGGLQEFIVWPERFLYPLPDRLSDADGAMLEPLGVALYAVDLADLKPGMVVGVFGCGPIGLLIIQLAHLSGAAQIIATDRMPHRLEAARAFGATDVFLVDETWVDEPVWKASGERGLPVAFEVAGENQAVETAMAAARPGGRVVLVGIPYPDVTMFTASTARRKGLTLQLCRRMKFTYPRAIRLVEQGLVDVRSLVTHHFPLTQAEQAFRMAQARQGLKVIIEPSLKM
jgi:L-iditol 2-dehydrogenase